MRKVASLVVVVTGLLVGCSHHGALRQRAAFDFRCTEAEIKITPLPHNQAGVEGCDHRGVYVLTTSGWVMNTEEAQAGEGARPAGRPSTAKQAQ